MRSSIDVANYLLAEDIPHELVPLPGRLRDLAAAPEVLGLPVEAVGRPTVLADGEGVTIVLAPAGAAVHTTGVRELLGRQALTCVAADEVPALTGYLDGWVPPVACEAPATVVVDERVAAQDVIYTAAGEVGMILKVRGPDLVKATSAVVAQVSGSGGEGPEPTYPGQAGAGDQGHR